MSDPGSAFNTFGNGSRYELKKAMTKLELFMKVEKALLQRKHNPGHKIFHEDPATAEAMLEFVNAHSDLGKMAFWTNLSREKQIDAFGFMSSRDISPHTILSVATRKKADLFIVLSGTGTEVNQSTKAVREVKMGCVLGAVEVFERYLETSSSSSSGTPINNTSAATAAGATYITAIPAATTASSTNTTTSTTAPANRNGGGSTNQDTFKENGPPTEYLITMPRGNLIRLRYTDFIISQFGVAENVEHAFLMRASPAEKLVFEARKHALSVYPPEAIETLEGSALMPAGVEDPAFHYLHRGLINRRVEVHRGEAPSVYCLLSGSLNVLLKSHRATAVQLKHHNAGLSTMRVKVSGAPILQLHKGAVFYIDDGVFDIDANTDEPLSKRLDKVAQKHSHVKQFLEKSHSMAIKAAPPLPFASSATPPTSAGAATDANTRAKGPRTTGSAPVPEVPEESSESGPAFHLELVFASDCIYLRLPKTDFLESMREPTPSSIGMLRRVKEQSQILSKKISSFDIWTSGHVEISLQHQHRPGIDFLEAEAPNVKVDVFDTSHHLTRQPSSSSSRPKLQGAVSFHVQGGGGGGALGNSTSIDEDNAADGDDDPFGGGGDLDGEQGAAMNARGSAKTPLTDDIYIDGEIGALDRRDTALITLDDSVLRTNPSVADTSSAFPDDLRGDVSMLDGINASSYKA